MIKQKTYIAIDLKSFYASVECHQRFLDPLTAKLVVADASRTSKTICLAVSPALKAYGISGRCRLFEVEAKAREVKRQTGKDLDYIIAPPQMATYMKYSAAIYEIYLRYFSPEDIHVYSIDEVFIDASSYLSLYKTTAHELAIKVIHTILKETGITATVGIGPNLYLCKIAMDIVAKHIPADKDGVRIATLDEASYRRQLWEHRPITDFWRVGKRTANRLEKHFLFTMGDIARCSLQDPELLYKEFGIDAEIMIDHAWGKESVTIKDIKEYKSAEKSLGSGQVLQHPYTWDKAEIIVKEMTELLALDLYKKNLVTNSLVLQIGYDKNCLENANFNEDTVTDFYGRELPKPSHGSTSLGQDTNALSVLVGAMVDLYRKIVNKNLMIRRVNISASDVFSRNLVQPGLFEGQNTEVDDKLQKVRLEITEKFGKNAILKGMDFEEGAMTRERNNQIGGHKA